MFVEPVIEQEQAAQPPKLPEIEVVESPQAESSSEVLQSAPEKQDEVVPTAVETPIAETLEVPSEALEMPTPRRRARVNYADLAAGSPAKTPSRRGRSASIEAAESVKATPKPPRSARKIMSTIEEKSSNENETEQQSNEIEGKFLNYL